MALYEGYLFKVQQDGWTLRYVPERLMTEEICRLAVQKYGYALQFVPERLKTEEICRLAVQKNVWTLEDVPERLKTEEMCRLAVQKNGDTLEFVPERLKTEEMCRLAVQQNERVFQFVPQTIKDIWETFIFTLSEIPEILSMEELEDPVTFEPPVKGEIYGLLSVGETWKIGISYETAKKFIKEKFRGSNKQKIFVPLVNEMREISSLKWVKF